MSWQTQQSQHARSWIKANGWNAAKDNPRTPVTSRGCWGGKSSAKGSSQQLCTLGSGCWQKPHQGVREYLKPRLTRNLIIFTTEKKKPKKLPKAEVSVKHYLVVYLTSSNSVLPRLSLPVIRTCIQTPAPLEWHRHPVQGVTLRCGALPQHHQCTSPLHAHLSQELRGARTEVFSDRHTAAQNPSVNSEDCKDPWMMCSTLF